MSLAMARWRWRLTPRFLRRRSIDRMNEACELIRARLEITHLGTMLAIERRR